MRKFITFGLALVMVLTLVVGVTSAQDESVLVIGWEQEPSKLGDRADMTFGSLYDSIVARGVWDWDINREIYPVMVTEIPTFENGMVRTLDNGNTQVEYHLREGMLWSDGEPITSADCQFRHDLYMNPEMLTFQRGNYPDVVESFEVIDDYSFVLTYNRPWPDYNNDAYMPCDRPAHVFADMLAADGNIDASPFWDGQGYVGYGPYMITEWNLGDSIVMEKNPYWDGEEGKFDKVVTRFITETAQMVNAMEAGEIDVAYNFPDPQVAAYQAIDGVEVWKTDGVYGDAIWMNVGNGGHPAMSDPLVREAIIRAIDRNTLAEELIGPGTGVPKSWLSAQFWPEDLAFWDYDEAQANALLDEAGWVDSNGDGTRDKDGQELVLRFYTTTRQIRMDYQVFIQEYLAKVGITVQLLPIPSGVLFGSFLERGILDTGDFDMAIFALSTGPLSPAFAAPTWFGCEGTPSAENPNGNNGWGSCDPEFDRVDLEVSSTVDPQARLELAYEAERLFFGMQFWHGLYLRPTWYAASSATLDTSTMQDLGTLNANYFNKIEFWAPAM